MLNPAQITTYNIIVTTADGNQLLVPFVGDPNISFGALPQPKEFTSVAIVSAFQSSIVNCSFDNVSRGAITSVPEAATPLLVAIGCLSIAAVSFIKCGSLTRFHVERLKGGEKS